MASKDGGPAFPCARTDPELRDAIVQGRTGLSRAVIDRLTELFPGMSLRDWFAGQALMGLLATDTDFSEAVGARQAYDFADAMIREREATHA
jgi:hypothetical protein